ncbi:AMP-binding protein [Ramlibacter sp. G-1-2-2]|uniref:AMP-binding protein n=1 Tax=Ramlibacter agri TaxID=2728837 RepID=A0A848H6N1_9BURK|nr:AMP-binding protein [Ramlibacter agri]NML43348.1 AMP-binding protein [Ramlibacter agri]
MELDLRLWATQDPGRLAVRAAGRDTSYGELEALTNQIAHVLQRQGVRRGDHVAAVIGNDVMIFAVVWGAYRLGAYITPIPSTASAADAAYVVADCGASVVVVNAALAETMASLPALAPSVGTWLSVHGAMPGFQAMEPLLRDAPATPVAEEHSGALMMYTSGTTGKPKGVIRPLPAQRQATPAFAADLCAMFDITAGARYLSTAPLYHAAPLRWGLAFLAAGGSVIAMGKFDAAEALDLIERERITHSQWVPTMFHRMLALPEERRRAFHAPEHRMAVHAAAPCAVPLKRAMIEWWGPIIEEYYSGSEGVGLTAISTAEWLGHAGSVGRAKKGVLHVLGDDDQELGAGQTGRIFFSGISHFAYHNAPEKTAARTSRQGFQTFGDVGHVDEEGYLFLTDRLDDMIISGGVNIYPQELEGAISEMPEVAEAAVIGAPDPVFGEKPVCFVVPRPSVQDPAAFVERLDAWCRDRLGRIKRPREFRVLQALPYSAQGKLLRRELRRLLA